MPAGKAKESRAFGSPSRYVQGPGEIRNLPQFASNYGNTAMVIIDTFFFEEYKIKIPEMFAACGMTAYPTEYAGNCTEQTLHRLIHEANALPKLPDVFIGIGGGQVCDMNKAVGVSLGKAVINVPTSLATDAPTSTHSIINNDGQMPYLMVHHKNPDYVVVDTEITVNAPLHMLISGIGDALATYVEAEASWANNNVCNAGGGTYRPTMLGMAVAKLAYDTLLEKGRAAVRAAKAHVRTPAYEDVAEATILLSGLGFECTGVSIAHGLQAAFHVLDAKPMLHGAGVGYCTLIQLILMNDNERFEQIFDFCKAVGLPVCTKDIGLTEENRQENIAKLVNEAYANRWNVQNMPFHISREMLRDAICYLDAYAAEQA